MKKEKELIFSGYILCDGLTPEELKHMLNRNIFSKTKDFEASKIEIHFGPALFNRLCDDNIIKLEPPFTPTIHEIPCRISFRNAYFAYYVFLKSDHKDRPDIKKQLNAAFGVSSISIDNMSGKIKKVIFNPPATIIFWKDGSKTVVKCNGEAFDPEKGMAMAISRKVLGDSYDYYNVFEKWCKKYKEPKSILTPQEVAAKYMTPPIVSELNEQLQMAAEAVKRYSKTELGDSDAD